MHTCQVVPFLKMGGYGYGGGLIWLEIEGGTPSLACALFLGETL